MIVTELIPLTKNRYKVYIDNEFAFVLYKGELHMYHIEVGRDISETDYEEITQKVLPKRAKLRAMKLLQKKTYTEKQLMDKLMEGFYPESLVQEAIAYVKSYHYVDDLRYALDYITYHQASKPLNRIRDDLFRKGIAKDVLEAAMVKWEEQGGENDELSMVNLHLQKKGYADNMERKEKQRIYAYLLRKGFSVETITKAMKNLT